MPADLCLGSFDAHLQIVCVFSASGEAQPLLIPDWRPPASSGLRCNSAIEISYQPGITLP